MFSRFIWYVWKYGYIKDQINESMENVFPEGVANLELTDSKGRKDKYDYEAGEITVNSSILTITNYLFLLILFLF